MGLRKNQKDQKDKTSKHKKRRKSRSSYDDDSHESDSTNSSQSSSEDNSDSNMASDDNSGKRKRIDSPKLAESEHASKRTRFDPLSYHDDKWALPGEMADYVELRFTEFITDKTLQETVLHDVSLPDNVDILKVPEIDDYVADIFDDSGKYMDKSHDKNLSWGCRAVW